MNKSFFETVNELVNNVNAHGCRVTIPYATPSPLTVMFDGGFSGAEYIPAYPSALHIFGISGHITVCDSIEIVRERENRYIISFGGDDDPAHMDMLVRILD